MKEDSPKDRPEDDQPGLDTTGVAERKDRIMKMESFLKEASAMVGAEVRRVEGIREILENATAKIEADLKEKEETISKKEAALKGLEIRLADRIRELEVRIREQEAIIDTRDAEIENLKTRLHSPSFSARPDIPPTEPEATDLREETEEAADADEESAAKRGASPFARSLRDIVVKRGKVVKIGTGHGPRKARLRTLLAPVQKKA